VVAVTLTVDGILNALAQQYAHTRSCTAAASAKAAAKDTDDDARHLRQVSVVAKAVKRSASERSWRTRKDVQR
jgi:hypothetical protein